MGPAATLASAPSLNAGEQLRHAIVVHDQHDHIHGLPTELQAKAASVHDEKSGRAPAFACPARSYSASITQAKNEATI